MEHEGLVVCKDAYSRYEALYRCSRHTLCNSSRNVSALGILRVTLVSGISNDINSFCFLYNYNVSKVKLSRNMPWRPIGL
jgi:hypothetical protein